MGRVRVGWQRGGSGPSARRRRAFLSSENEPGGSHPERLVIRGMPVRIRLLEVTRRKVDLADFDEHEMLVETATKGGPRSTKPARGAPRRRGGPTAGRDDGARVDGPRFRRRL